MAFLHAPGQGDQLASLEELKSRARELQKFYQQNSEEQSCLVTKSDYRQTSESPVSVYPNPANHQLFIELGDDAQLQASTIFSITGQKVLEFKREKILNLTSLPTGAYILKCSTTQGVHSFKILKR